tara:strand:+ start:4607 stop:5026 length:420 start_codon:yes stop_codon:yes gene_type:complete
MGILNVDKIQNTSGISTCGVNSLHYGLCQAWISFDGEGTSNDQWIYDSHNIAAVRDIATGRYAIYFEVPFSTGSTEAAGVPWTMTGSASNGSGMSTTSTYFILISKQYDDGMCEIVIRHTDGSTEYDRNFVTVAFFGGD